MTLRRPGASWRLFWTSTRCRWSVTRRSRRGKRCASVSVVVSRHTCTWADCAIRTVQSRPCSSAMACTAVELLCCMLPCTQESRHCVAKVCEGSLARASLEQAPRFLSCYGGGFRFCASQDMHCMRYMPGSFCQNGGTSITSMTLRLTEQISVCCV